MPADQATARLIEIAEQSAVAVGDPPPLNRSVELKKQKMTFFEKSHFQWKDPGDSSKEASGVLRSSLFKLLGVIVLSSTVFLMILYIGYNISILKPIVALTAIVLFIFAIYYIHARFPKYIVLKDTCMYRGFNDETADLHV
jgi:hypothetical protein